MSTARQTEVCCAVTFRLRAAADAERFVALSRSLRAWLHTRDGFVRYELFASSGDWMDTMIWRDRAAAEQGNKAFLKTPLATEMVGLVETGYRSLIAERIALDTPGAEQ